MRWCRGSLITYMPSSCNRYRGCSCIRFIIQTMVKDISVLAGWIIVNFFWFDDFIFIGITTFKVFLKYLLYPQSSEWLITSNVSLNCLNSGGIWPAYFVKVICFTPKLAKARTMKIERENTERKCLHRFVILHLFW